MRRRGADRDGVQLPGVGQLAWQSIENLDFPVIMATVLIAAVFVVVMNFIVDIVYSLIDPRISLS
ncbi:hypothetical protein GCM10025857_24790 [Alicyclobacillus contaminans]|nr:hypothetical protein GCM10025857_24790 [Alicyclobacillus contaminans]